MKIAWRKSPPELIEKFEAALPADAAVERRKMFGYPCAFVRGNMFAGLHQENLIVRLSEEQRAGARREGAQTFEPLPGRPMQEYVAVPPAVLEDDEVLRRWLQRAFDYASGLPAKLKAPRPRAAPRAAAKRKRPPRS